MDCLCRRLGVNPWKVGGIQFDPLACPLQHMFVSAGCGTHLAFRISGGLRLGLGGNGFVFRVLRFGV